MRVIRSVCLLAALGLSVPAGAQVTVDLHALDKPGATAAPAEPSTGTAAPAQHHHAGKTTHHTTRTAHGHATTPEAKTAKGTGAPTGTPATAAPAKPETTATTRPVAPPPAATLPTVVPPEVHLAPLPEPAAPPPGARPASPPLAPPVAADAGSDALHIADGMRVTFQPNHADLTPETTDALKRFADSVPRGDGVTLDVRAYAAPAPDDPSASRRLSLSRSLAVRAVLMAEGIPSTRIFVRALGPHSGNGPADRCDVMIGRIGAEPPPPGAAEAPARQGSASSSVPPAATPAVPPAAPPATATSATAPPTDPRATRTQ